MREREENRSDYQSFVPVLAERAPENSLDVAKVSVAEMRGADDNVVTLHGAATASSAAAAASTHPAPTAAARRGWRGWAGDPPRGHAAAPGTSSGDRLTAPLCGARRGSPASACSPRSPSVSRSSVSLLIRVGTTSPAGGFQARRGPGRRNGAERESVPARRPGGAGLREPPARQQERRRRQHPPRSAPALGVAAAGRHECYYSERRCRSIALSQWQGATGLILRAVRGVHLSPAASPAHPAAGTRGRASPSASGSAPRGATAAEGRGRDGHRQVGDSWKVGAERKRRGRDFLPGSRRGGGGEGDK